MLIQMGRIGRAMVLPVPDKKSCGNHKQDKRRPQKGAFVANSLNGNCFRHWFEYKTELASNIGERRLQRHVLAIADGFGGVGRGFIGLQTQPLQFSAVGVPDIAS